MTSLHQSPDFDPNAHPIEPFTFDALPERQWPGQWHPTDRFPTPQSVGQTPLEQELSSLVSFDGTLKYYRLGDPNLPVAPYREHFIQTVRDNQSSVACGETGSGKSSQFGLFLLEAGFPQVIITQPRILAARNLYHWTRQNLGPDYEDLVGYITGNAEDSDMSESARLIFGVEQSIYNMACEGQLRKDAVIVHDEVHERTGPTIMFLGIMKELLKENPDMRQVSCSATFDTDLFARYHGTAGQPAPVMVLPGRTFPVNDEETTRSVASAARRHMARDRNVLVFEPGVSRMQATRGKMWSGTKEGQEVHVLYGDQSAHDQEVALNPDNGHHIVATRPAETSITPQNKQAVVDSGLANVGRYKAGVRELETVFADKATLRQRRGRVGREMEGFYTLAVPDDAPPPPAYEDRPDYGPPAIQNTSVASYLLPLLASGRRLENLDLLEYPTAENLEYDYTLLRRLGATALSEQGEPALTDIGKAMAALPLDAPLARMLVEAGRKDEDGDYDRDAVQLQVAAATAIQQVNGILDMRQGSQRRFVRRKTYQGTISNEGRSDMLFALDVFVWLYEKQQELMASGDPNAESKFLKILHANDILASRYDKAVSLYEEICHRLELDANYLERPTEPNRQRIIACQLIAAEELFVRRSKTMHRDKRGEHRTLGRRSTIAPNIAHLVVGTAFNLRGMRERGSYTRRFISGGSVVTAEDLIKHVPERIVRRSIGFGVSPQGKLVERQALYFDGEMQFAERQVDLQPTLESRVALVHAMMRGKAPSVKDPEQIVGFKPGTPNATRAINQWRKAQTLEHKSGLDLDVEGRYLALIRRVINKTLKEVPLDVTDPAELDKYIPKRVMRDALVHPDLRDQLPEIDRQSPDAIAVHTAEDETRDLPVTYKNGIAYITVPRDLRLTVRREDFKELQTFKDIKLRVANGKYHPIDAIFELLDEQRATEAAKQARRAEYRLATAHRDLSKPTRRELRDDFSDQVEEQLRKQAKAVLSKRLVKGLPQNIRRQKLRQQTEKLRSKQVVA